MTKIKFLIGLALTAAFLAACSSTPQPTPPIVWPPIADAPCAVPAK